MLIKRGLITKALRKVVDVILLHLRLFEAGRAAAGQTLTEAVPVILTFNAGTARADQRNHIATVVAAPGENIYPVGKQRTCAIEFLTVQPPAAFNGRYAGENLPSLTAPISVQPLPTSSPSRKRRNQRSRAGESG